MIAPRNTPAPTRPRAEVDEIAAVVDAVRVAAPLTQCLTNSVVTGFTANVLLAVGASPAVVDSREEGPIFADIADGLLINVGTVNAMTVDSMLATAAAREDAGRTWCLDPVAVGALPVRTALARDLLEHRPSVVRGNASEVLGLVGETGAGRGVDAGDDVDSALDVAAALAARTGGAVAVSGEVDAVVATDTPTLRIANGHPIMTKVTGVGCALGAMVAAYLPVARTPHLAAAAATAALTVAAEEAARRAAGPGSFAVELLDALARVDSETVTANLDLR
ncbi:hydroxyethylthiazole kinase [Dermacoccus abyssi]|uniref:hydroxyethylthiazole kinase n=1 Tax=Dermacoccus abyssi TaxID=322596 RepID=UPI002AD3722E|nr:hydroxyethylthiazole kinase [Dermacoccus abyssi]